MQQTTTNLQPDKHLQTQRVTAELITYVVEKIARGVAPEQVILFGSQARGEATVTSDLDLFVIQDGRQTNREVRRKIEAMLLGRWFSMDLIVRKPEEVARNLADNNPFYTQDIFSEGKVLYERPGQAAS